MALPSVLWLEQAPAHLLRAKVGELAGVITGGTAIVTTTAAAADGTASHIDIAVDQQAAADGSRRENVVSKQCRWRLVLIVVLLPALAVPAVAALPAPTSVPILTEQQAGISLWQMAARAGVGVPDHRPHKLRRTAKHKVAASQ